MLEAALLPTKLSSIFFFAFVILYNVGPGMTSCSGSVKTKSFGSCGSGSTTLLPTLAVLFSELGFHAVTWSGRRGSVSSKASMLGQTTILLAWSHSWVAVVLNPPSMLMARRDTFSGTSWPSVSCEKNPNYKILYMLTATNFQDPPENIYGSVSGSYIRSRNCLR